MTKEELLKEFEGQFMNNGVSGVLDDQFQDSRMVRIREFLRLNI